MGFCVWFGLGFFEGVGGRQKQYVISDEIIRSLGSLSCGCDESWVVQKTVLWWFQKRCSLGLLSHTVDAAHFRNLSRTKIEVY